MKQRRTHCIIAYLKIINKGIDGCTNPTQKKQQTTIVITQQPRIQTLIADKFFYKSEEAGRNCLSIHQE